MILDYLILQLFGTCSSPIEMACRFLLVVLILNGIFSALSSLLHIGKFD